MTRPTSRSWADIPLPFAHSLRGAFGAGPVGRVWGRLRGHQQHQEYLKIRDHYANRATELGLVVSEEETTRQVRKRLASRGMQPSLRDAGDIHCFVFLAGRRPHGHLLPDLRELGPVSQFDYEQLGFTVGEFRGGGRRGLDRRREMNALVLPALKEAQARRRVDWVLMYGNGSEIDARTVQAIIDETGLPTVSLSMDDTHAWIGSDMDGQPAGQVGLASVFDLAWTTSPLAREWFLVEGGRPIAQPTGVDITAYRPSGGPRDIPVSFVGGAYGYRPDVIKVLRRHGIPIQVFGKGWPDSGYVADLVAVTNRSQINLGIGGIGYREDFTNLKGRDFDVPGTGGGLYLTTFSPDLTALYDIGREIVCYRSRDEMVEQLRYYLARPDEANAIAQRGYQRAITCHRWRHRYERVLQVLGLLPAVPVSSPSSVST